MLILTFKKKIKLKLRQKAKKKKKIITSCQTYSKTHHFLDSLETKSQ